jgi:F-type H+-transporting ATPase subunit delta
MREITIAERYAIALLEIGVEKNSLESLAQELNRVTKLFEQSAELSNIMTHPRVSVDARKKVISELMSRVTIGPTCQNFVKLLIDRKRINLLSAVVTHYHHLVDLKLGRLRAELTSAALFSDDEVQALKVALDKHTGKEVIVECKVDERLIGGVITRVDGKVIDGSLRARLDGLGDTLRAAL